MAMYYKWTVLVAVILVTFPSLGHSRKELGSPGRNTRKNKPTVTQIVEVTTEVTKNETTSDFDVTEPTKNHSDSTSIPGDPSEVGEHVQVEEDSVTTALTTHQNQATEPTIFSWLYGRIMYAFESYSKSDSLWSWITGLGGGEGDAISTTALAESRLHDFKFSPFAYEIVEYLRPWGFKPYPDPYEPLYLDKDDIWKFALNWLIGLGILSTMWRSYGLPLPFGLYEKFGIILAPPGFDPDAENDDNHDVEDEEKEEDEDEEEEEDDPYGDDDEEEEEEDDPNGDDDEEEKEKEEEDDPHGDDDKEEKEEDDEEDNYYKVGEEEEEEEKEREHESFAVFRQKDPEDEDDEEDDRYNDEDEDEMEMDDGEMDEGEMNDGEMDDGEMDDMGSEEGVSSYTFYNIPGDEEMEEKGMTGDDDNLNGDSKEKEEAEEEEESSYTSYKTSNASRRIDHTRGTPQTKRVRKPSKKTSGTSHRPKTASKTPKRRVQKFQSRPTSRPSARPSQDSYPLSSSSFQRPPPGVAALRNAGKVAGNRPLLRRPYPTRPGNVLRPFVPRRPPLPSSSSSSSSSSFFPFSLFT
ncbi:uncharacterized protein DDB_G0283697-like [Eriocheir sinensis]|uniref:uncharacterized protein DDB_G0283697-like n=1 Tax=Eriocheir sinensis TaxID=95602 RepID=UPI0021CAAB8C|nr:uncharacterized protein DDB_G0283697-like [Eriocheir sinensis]